jgi:hypothetical protein
MKILKHPLDKILDGIPGGSPESIPRNLGITFDHFEFRNSSP